MIQNKRTHFLQHAVINIIFTFISLCCVVPILLIVSAAFTDELALAKNGYQLIPSEFSLAAMKYVFKYPEQILRAYGVTITVTVIGTIGSILCTSTLAYTMSRRDFKLHRLISFLAFFVLLFNGGMVSSYIVNVQYYHLKDSILAMILPYIIVPWHVFLMKGFMSDMPMELIEAAKIDGATEPYIFFKIVMPISKAGLATVGLFTAFTYWNDWWLSMLYINESKLTSLQYYLYRIMNNIEFLRSSMASNMVSINRAELPSETARMALCIVAIGPMLIAFPFFQKYFVKGITVGSVKG